MADFAQILCVYVANKTDKLIIISYAMHDDITQYTILKIESASVYVREIREKNIVRVIKKKKIKLRRGQA